MPYEEESLVLFMGWPTKITKMEGKQRMWSKIMKDKDQLWILFRGMVNELSCRIISGVVMNCRLPSTFDIYLITTKEKGASISDWWDNE